MSRKDFQAIAEALLESRRILDAQPERDALEVVTGELMLVLHRSNPRFDKARFLKAAGVQS